MDGIGNYQRNLLLLTGVPTMFCMGYTALLFCPDEKTARTVTQVLSELEFAVEACIEPFAAVKKLMGTHFDAVVVDCDNEQNATLLFKSARNSTSNQTSLAVAVVEGQAGVAKAFRIGANLVLTKPINIEQAKGTLRVARGLLRKSEPGKPAAPGAVPAATPAAPATLVAAKPAPTRTIPAAKPPAPKPTATIPPANSPLPPRPVTTTVAKPATTQAWPAAATSSKPAAKDEDPLGIDAPETKPAPTAELSTPQITATPKVTEPKPVASAIPTMSSGAASAPAPAREPLEPKIAEKPAEAIPSAAQKPVESTPIEAAYVGAAPTFNFGGANAEPESSGGKKKIIIGIAAAVVLAAVGIFIISQWKSHPTSAPAPASETSGSVTPPLPKPSAEPAPVNSATASAPNTADVPASNDTESVSTEPSKPAPSKSSKPASTASTAESKPAEPAEPEPAPMVVKSGKEPSKPNTGATDAPAAPSMVGMATPGAAPPPSLVADSSTVKPLLQTLSISQGVSQGLLYHKVAPVYPPNAIRMQVEGEVQLQATISKSGDISQIKVISGSSQLTKAAVDAVKQWKYKPYLLNGEPVEIQTQITVNFRLPH